MRSALFLLVGIRAFAQFANLSGVAVDATTGSPLPGVHVLVFSIPKAPAYTPPVPYGAQSKPDGRFSIANIAPGGYILQADLTGYVQVSSPESPGRGLSLKPGENRSDFKLEMTPRALISGRITDSFGDPVQNATVEAFTAENGTNASMMTRSDERGHFRLSGAPGKYHVRAAFEDRQRRNIPEVRSDGSHPESYAPAWYPEAASAEQASVVTAAAGRDVTAIDIRLSSRTTHSVHGVISGIPEGSLRPMVFLFPSGDALRQVNGVNYSVVDKNGGFSFLAVPAGVYSVLGRLDGNVALRTGVTELRVENADTSVALRLTEGAELPGVVRFDGQPGAGVPNLTVKLEPARLFEQAYLGSAESAATGPDGGYRLKPVFPGHFRLVISPMPENSYIRSIRTEAPEPVGVLDFSHGVPSRLEIVLSRKAATISGKVSDVAGATLNSPLATVYLISKAEDLDPYQPKNTQSVSADSGFTFHNVPPGRYRIFAIDPLAGSGAAETLQRIFNKAEEIEVKEEERIVKDLKIAGGANAH